MVTENNKITYFQPFETGILGCERYRIPAILTLNNGTVMAAADMRYSHGSDSPNNIDSLLAFSKDGYSEWDYKVLNRFDDYADGETDVKSASFIDCALAQSKKTGRIFVLTDAWTAGGGYPTAKKGTGFTKINGKPYLLLRKGGKSTDSLDSFKYYIGDHKDGFSEILSVADGSESGYQVDGEFRLYKDSHPLYQKQIGSENEVQQNVFYYGAEFCAYNSCYLWLRYSDDNGETWSQPLNITGQVKFDHEMFFGVGPGQGVVTEVNGNERVIFCVYNNKGIGIGERVCTIYSDDNGITWHRGEKTSFKPAVQKTSESQIVTLPGGTLRMFSRNKFAFIAYADSTDGGVTWSQHKSDLNLPANGNCMVSFINVSKKIGGKNVILGSFVANQNERADGNIVVGVVNDDNSINWIYQYRVNKGFFAYSCLTELSDGNIGYLYEDEPAHIAYKILSIDDNGNLSEINGNNIDFKDSISTKNMLKTKFRSIAIKFFKVFNLL